MLIGHADDPALVRVRRLA